MKQIGLGLMMYVQDHDETYPLSYYYPFGTGGASGYMHWSWQIGPYVKNWQLFVCPSDKNKGLDPTNAFDLQAPRISYISNEVLMGRPRAQFRVVTDAMVEDPSSLIAIAEITDYKYGIGGTSGPSGDANKSHRPANAVNPWNNDSTWAAAYAYVSDADWAAAETSAAAATSYLNDETQTHLRYAARVRHNGGCNYAFADGHAKWMPPSATLVNRLWGTRFYSLFNNAPIY